MSTTNSTSNRVAITGNTYPVKDALRALGATWNPAIKAWMVPAEKAAEAERLVQSAARPAPSWRSNGGSYSGGSSGGYVTCGYCDGRYPRGGLCPRCGDEG